MSYKPSQEPHPSYMDGVKVKISERYKPPPKIILPMSYSQRLSLNNHIQDNMPKYDFSFEKNAKEYMRAVRTAKSMTSNQRKERLEKIKEAREREKQDKMKKEQDQNCDTNIQKDETIYNLNNSKQLDNYPTYPSSTAVLIPTQVSSTYTKILTPTLLSDSNTQSYNCQPADKSPFNISDFEADTSSPFDNMALKTINDMAELAIVLQNEDNINKKTYNYTPVSNARAYTQTYTNYTGNQQYNFTELPSTSTTAYVQPANCVYSGSNGYYYDTLPSVYDSSYLYNNTNVHDYNSSFDATTPRSTVENSEVAPRNPIPDIMKALQTELNNTHINKTNQLISSTVSSNKEKRNKERSNSESKSDSLDELYKNLPKNLQVLSKSISGMGFPLDRVSRVCKLLGDDQKKVVEHLLAMSDLLDLGFSETQVSSALIQCDNDRDKALDKLIL